MRNDKMINVFLTGEVGAGKSTVISRFLSLVPQIKCGGFRTVSAEPITSGAMLDVFIEKAWEQTPHDTPHLVGSRFEGSRFDAYPSSFDLVGKDILANAPSDASIILMDELGKMENDALLFQKAVMDVLDGELPVLGVIKPKQTSFLDAVRSHERSVVIDVTEENRDGLPLKLIELLQIVN